MPHNLKGRESVIMHLAVILLTEFCRHGELARLGRCEPMNAAKPGMERRDAGTHVLAE